MRAVRYLTAPKGWDILETRPTANGQQTLQLQDFRTMTMSANCDYRPSPLERAHASHLLATYFSTPFDPSAADDAAEVIRVPGRAAVPFLTTSGVDRGLLRRLWAVADPAAVGTLTSRGQVHALLRLVAMAQAGLLPPGGADADAHLGALRAALADHARLVVALPTFRADADPPSVARLLSAYPPPPPPAAGVGALLTDHDLQYRMWQERMAGGGGAAAAPADGEGTMSVSDAFGSLGEVEDRPLPSLTAATAPPVGENIPEAADANDPSSLALLQGEQSLGAPESGHADVGREEDVGDNGGVPVAPPSSKQLGAVSTSSFGGTTTGDVISVDNHFGDFDGKSLPATVEESAPGEGQKMTTTHDDHFGEFASHDFTARQSGAFEFPDASDGATTGDRGDSTALVTNEGQMMATADRDDLGGFASRNSTAPQSGVSHLQNATRGVTAEGWSYDSAVMDEVKAESTAADDNAAAGTFGAFGGLTAVAANAEDPDIVVNDKGESFGSFGGFGDSAPAVAGSEDVDAVVKQGDHSFGTFGGFTDAAVHADGDNPTAHDTDAAETETDHHSFGGFEDAAPVAGADEIAVADGNEHLFLTTQNSGEEEPGVLGAGIVYPNNDDAANGDGVGFVDGVNIAEENTQCLSQGAHSGSSPLPGDATSGHSTGDNKLSAFDALATVPDAPLPPLGCFASTSGGMENEAAEKTEIHSVDFASSGDAAVSGFGDFEVPAEQTSCVEEEDGDNTNVILPSSDMPQNVPVSGNEVITASNEMKVIADDGGFDNSEVPSLKDHTCDDVYKVSSDTAVAAENAETKDTAAADKLSVFDALVETSDAPLPPLGSFSKANDLIANTLEERDKVEKENDIDNSKEGTLLFNEPEQRNNDKDVGATILDGLGATESNNTDGDKLSSAFDVFGEVQDVPLPQLDAFTPFRETAQDNRGLAKEASALAEDGMIDKDDGFNAFEGPGELVQKSDKNVNANAVINAEDTNHTIGNLFGAVKVSAPSDSVKSIAGPSEPPHVSTNSHCSAEDEGDLFGDFGGPSTEKDEENNFETFPAGLEQLGDVSCRAKDVEKLPEYDKSSQANESFGQFETVAPESPEATSKDLEQYESTIPAATENQLKDNDDDFGMFEGVGTEQSTDDTLCDDAGGLVNFSSFGDAPLDKEQNFDQGAEKFPDNTSNEKNEDSFGTFEGVVTTQKIDDTFGGDASGGFGDFSSFGSTPLDQEQNSSNVAERLSHKTSQRNDISLMQVKTVAPEVSNEAGANNNLEEFEASFPPEDIENNDVDFGTFETVGSTEIANDTAGGGDVLQSSLGDPSDGFGDFSSFDNAPAAQEPDAAVATEGLPDYDDTSQKNVSARHEVVAPEFPAEAAPSKHLNQFEPSFPASSVDHIENNDDDFGNFEGVDTVQNDNANYSAGGEAPLQSEIDDFGDGFGDFSSFEDTPVTQEQDPSNKKNNLEEILQSTLGEEFGKLPRLWKIIFEEVEKDLQRGNNIMDYLSKNIPSKDKAIIIKSEKLHDHIFGLAELVRIIRSISASIGELIDMKKNIDVQKSTLAKWNHNAIIADAIVIDHLWSDIVTKALTLEIVPEAPQLESVVEIRARGGLSLSNSPQKNIFCQVTLQPFDAGGTGTTRSPVEWNGKKYMACTANFCANRSHLRSMI